MTRKYARAAGAALACAAALLVTRPLSAQGAYPVETPRWAGNLASFGANTLLGGLTGGVLQKARGGSFQDGFARGALGGGIVYVGKRVAAERFAGAGLLGREVAAVGGSVVRNAAEARPSLSRVMLPLGPVHLYLEPGARRALRARVDLMSLVWTGYALTRSELEWDARATFSAGAPVFRAPDLVIDASGEDEEDATGTTRAGVVYLSDLAGVDYDRNAAHERVHVLQYDQIFQLWTAPAEAWLLRRLPGGDALSAYLDPNASQLVVGALAGVFKNYRDRPWELEARFLVRQP